MDRDFAGAGTRNVNSIFFIGFLFLCLFYGKERVVLFDGSRAVFIVFNYKYPFFDENRLPTIINCLFPLLFSKLGFSIKWVINAYIVSYCFLPLSIFVFLRFIVRNEQQLTVFLLSLSFFFFHSFFVASHDTVTIFYFIFFLHFFLAAETVQYRKIRYFLVAFLILLIVFGHLSQLITMVLLVGYLFISKRLRVNFPFVMLFIIFSFLVKVFLFRGETETDMLNDFFTFHKSVVDVNYVLVGLLKSILSYNLSYLIIFVLTLLKLISLRKFSLATYLFISTLASVLFISYFFEETRCFNFYTEPHFKCLSVLLSVIFTDNILRHYRKNNKSAILVFIYLFSFAGLSYGGSFIKEYYDYVSVASRNLTHNAVFYTEQPMNKYVHVLLPIESAVINKYENDNGHFMAFTSGATLTETGFIPEQRKDVKSAFFFNDNVVVQKAPPEMKRMLELKYQNSYFEEDSLFEEH